MKYLLALSLVVALALAQSFSQMPESKQQESFSSQEQFPTWLREFVQNLTPQQKSELVQRLQGSDVQSSAQQSIENLTPDQRRILLEFLQKDMVRSTQSFNVEEFVRSLTPEDRNMLKEHFTQGRSDLPIHLKNKIQNLTPEQTNLIKAKLSQQSQQTDVHSVIQRLTPEQREALRSYFLESESGSGGESGTFDLNKMKEECAEWMRILVQGKISNKVLERAMQLSEHEAMQVVNYLLANPNEKEKYRKTVSRYIEGLSPEDQKALAIFILTVMEPSMFTESIVEKMTPEQRQKFFTYFEETKGGRIQGQTTDQFSANLLRDLDWGNRYLLFKAVLGHITVPENIRQRVTNLNDQQKRQVFEFIANHGTDMNTFQTKVRTAPDFIRKVFEGLSKEDIYKVCVLLGVEYAQKFVTKAWEQLQSQGGQEQPGQKSGQQQPGQKSGQEQQWQPQQGSPISASQAAQQGQQVDPQFQNRVMQIMRTAEENARRILMQAEQQVRQLYQSQGQGQDQQQQWSQQQQQPGFQQQMPGRTF